ncbi:class I SAM-dependent methyltransferase [Paenibacillus helianthi]|nr:class I SAM-dependent methyltransferase [Paenibacillus helianthi]
MLADQSVDLIVAANSYHLFQLESALEEFRRILRPEGWRVSVPLKYPLFT